MGLRKIKAKEKDLTKRQARGSQAGLFFTLGLDSSHSLLMLDQLPEEQNPKYLIHIKGYDVFKRSSVFYRKFYNNLEKVFISFSKTIIFISTNLRSLSNKIVNWEMYHGAAIIGSAHFLTSILNKVYIAADEYMTEPEQYGMGKEIDHLWESEAIQFLPDGEFIYRLDKIDQLVKLKKFFLVIPYLQSCFEKIENTSKNNCSKCPKCLVNSLGFLAVGYRKSLDSYDYPKSKDIKKIRITVGRMHLWWGIYMMLKKKSTIAS